MNPRRFPRPILSTQHLVQTRFLTRLSLVAAVTSCSLVGGATPLDSDEPPVLITEVMYNPASNERGGRSEWVELANVSDASITMNGWRLRDEDRTSWGVFDCHLPSGAVVVLVNEAHVDAQMFHEAWTAAPDAPTYEVVPVKWGALSNQPSARDEHLQLINAEGQVICAVNLGGDADWPRISGSGGPSVWLSDPSAATLNSGMVWHRSEAGNDGAIQSRRRGVFEGLDVGSPGVVPWLRPSQSSESRRDPEGGPKSGVHQGDRLLDYEAPASNHAAQPAATADPTPERDD